MFMRKILIVSFLLLVACKIPTVAIPLAPLPAGTPAPTFTPSPGFTVRYHPDGPLYVGDRASIEVLSPSGAGSKDDKVRISLDDPLTGAGQALDESEFHPFGIGGPKQADFF